MAGDRWDSLANSYSDARHLLFRPQGIVSESFSRDWPYQQSSITALTSGVLHLTAVPYQRGQVVSNLGLAFGPTAVSGLTRFHYSLWAHDTFPYIPPLALAGTYSNGAATLTGTGYTQAMQGRAVTGTNIPAGTYITGGLGTTILSMSANATGSGTAFTLGQYRARAKIANTDNVTAAPTASLRSAVALFNTITPTWMCPATGLYYHGAVFVATGMPDFMEMMTGAFADDYFALEAPILHGDSSTGQTTAGSLPAQAAAVTANRNRLHAYST